MNPTELLALTCVGEDDRKIIEEVKYMIRKHLLKMHENAEMNKCHEVVPAHSPQSYLKKIHHRRKTNSNQFKTGGKPIGGKSARKRGGGDA